MNLRIDETTDSIIVSFVNPNTLHGSTTREDGVRLHDIFKQASRLCKTLVIDFQGARFISSALIGRVLILIRESAKTGGPVPRFANVNENILQVLRLCGIDIGEGDDDPDGIGGPVPNPRPPSTLEGRAEPPAE